MEILEKGIKRVETDMGKMGKFATLKVWFRFKQEGGWGKNSHHRGVKPVYSSDNAQSEESVDNDAPVDEDYGLASLFEEA